MKCSSLEYPKPKVTGMRSMSRPWTGVDSVQGQILLGPNEATVVQGTWAHATQAGQLGFETASADSFFGNNASNAVDDELTWGIYLAQGTYKITLLHITASSGGKAHFEIDGVDVGNIDQYTAGTVLDVLASITGVVVSGSGLVVFGLKVSSKHASSSDHILRFNYIVIEKVA